MDRIGADGVITVEESRTIETTLGVVEGMQFDRGRLSPYFVSNTERMEAVPEDARVMVSDRKIGSLTESLPLLEQLAKSGRPVLFVAEDIEGEALATLVVNQIRAVLRSCAVRAPGSGDRRKDLRQDIAVLTGAEVISEELGTRLEPALAERDERAGMQTLLRALESPARTIAENSAADPRVVVEQMLGGGGSVGFDAARGR